MCVCARVCCVCNTHSAHRPVQGRPQLRVRDRLSAQVLDFDAAYEVQFSRLRGNERVLDFALVRLDTLLGTGSPARGASAGAPAPVHPPSFKWDYGITKLSFLIANSAVDTTLITVSNPRDQAGGVTFRLRGPAFSVAKVGHPERRSDLGAVGALWLDARGVLSLEGVTPAGEAVSYHVPADGDSQASSSQPKL